jgi:hypothetical protein
MRKLTSSIALHAMRHRRMARALFAVILLGLNACGCDHYEWRAASATAQISAPGAEVVQTVGISVEEYRSPDFKAVYFSVGGSTLRWHVRGFRLLEAQGEGRVLYDIPLETPGPDPDDAGHGHLVNVDPEIGSWEQFLVLLETSGVLIELTTDVPGMELVRVPVRAENAREWIRSECPSD